jgi:hypothetical protein
LRKKVIFAVMRFREPTLLLLACLVGGVCYAQISSAKKSPKIAKYRTNKVSKSKAQVMCPIFLESKYPYHGIGLKLGDPFAVTYKFYPSKHWSFAVDVGKAASGLYNKYYRNAYNAYQPDSIKSDTTHTKSEKYLAHKVLQDWFLEAKFLYQWDADKLALGLQFYAGVGWQFRNTKIRYDYNYTLGATTIEESKFGQFYETRFTYGPVAIVGFEYSYFSLPISAFIEVEWYTDAFLDPGYQRFQGGVGIRYVF